MYQYKYKRISQKHLVQYEWSETRCVAVNYTRCYEMEKDTINGMGDRLTGRRDQSFDHLSHKEHLAVRLDSHIDGKTWHSFWHLEHIEPCLTGCASAISCGAVTDITGNVCFIAKCEQIAAESHCIM